MRDLYDPLLAFRGLSDEPEEEETADIPENEEESGEGWPKEEEVAEDNESTESF